MHSPHRWLICVLLLLATTLNYLDRVALNQLITPIMGEFKLNDRDYARLEMVFDIAFGIGTLLTGWLVDRVNVRWVYPVVVLGWSVAGLLTSYSDTFTMLLLCRFSLGLFEAGNWPCGIRTTRTVLRPEERSFGNALFQSGTALGAILTPQVVLICFDIYGEKMPGVWAVPFRVIGLIGFAWVALWLLLAPGRLFPTPQRSAETPKSFANVLKDRRFWILVAVIFGVNTGWHTVRVWMPRLLQATHGLGNVEFQRFGTWYYLAADVGSWTVGLVTLYFARKRFPLFGVRLTTFIICTALLVAASTALPNVKDRAYLLPVMLVIGFAALGLFPTYFALSQDLSSQHQGKVTGTLGCINALYMAGMKYLQGEYATTTGDYAGLIAFSGLPAILACVLLLTLWRSKDADPT